MALMRVQPMDGFNGYSLPGHLGMPNNSVATQQGLISQKALKAVREVSYRKILNKDKSTLQDTTFFYPTRQFPDTAADILVRDPLFFRKKNEHLQNLEFTYDDAISTLDHGILEVFSALNMMCITHPRMTRDEFERRYHQEEKKAFLRAQIDFAGIAMVTSAHSHGKLGEANQRYDLAMQTAGTVTILNTSNERLTAGDFLVWDVPDVGATGLRKYPLGENTYLDGYDNEKVYPVLRPLRADDYVCMDAVRKIVDGPNMPSLSSAVSEWDDILEMSKSVKELEENIEAAMEREGNWKRFKANVDDDHLWSEFEYIEKEDDVYTTRGLVRKLLRYSIHCFCIADPFHEAVTGKEKARRYTERLQLLRHVTPLNFGDAKSAIVPDQDVLQNFDDSEEGLRALRLYQTAGTDLLAGASRASSDVNRRVVGKVIRGGVAGQGVDIATGCAALA